MNKRIEEKCSHVGLVRVEEAAAVSHDGHFVAFLSDHNGPMDVWVTQVGSGEFHNLTRGSTPELINPSVRSLGFSPDGSLLCFNAGLQKRPYRRKLMTGHLWQIPMLMHRNHT